MWAQMITTRLKPGCEDRLRELIGHLEAAEQADSGLLRSAAFLDQKDPRVVRMLVVFTSEDRYRVSAGGR